MINSPGNTLKNWIPYELFFDNDKPLCRWLYTANIRFTHPFFSETISAFKQHAFLFNPHGKVSVSSIGLLSAWGNEMDAVRPSAFIFHVSRCGSTLAAQLLGLNKDHIVLSETPFFDQLLRNHYTNAGEPSFVSILDAAMHFYGQKRLGAETRLFIKTDSWHILFYEQLRALYPGVPFILLYRRPDEVLRSQQKQRGLQAVPGLLEPEMFGFNKTDIKRLSLDEYMAKVLERYYTCFLDMAEKDSDSFLINYNEGAIKIVQKIATCTDTVLGDEEIALIAERSGYHSKHPGQVFTEPELDRQLPDCLYYAFELYNALEEKRIANSLHA